MNQILTHWQSLKPNEQLLLKVAGVILAIFLLFVLIIRPLNAKIDRAEKMLIQQQELVTYIKQSAVKIRSQQGGKVASGSLSHIINASSRRAKINISKMQPKDNTLRLTIESVEFNKLLPWIESLVERNGLVISALDISKGQEPGLVNVSRLVVEK